MCPPSLIIGWPDMRTSERRRKVFERAGQMTCWWNRATTAHSGNRWKHAPELSNGLEERLGVRARRCRTWIGQDEVLRSLVISMHNSKPMNESSHWLALKFLPARA
jgi:hypothetical protein